MVIGAIAAFAVTHASGSYALGAVSGALAGAAMGALFGFLTLPLMSNQVATGLALTMFGLGLSALIGQSYSGISLGQFPKVDIPLLSDLPFIGPLLFGQDCFVYLSVAFVAGVAYFLSRTREVSCFGPLGRTTTRRMRSATRWSAFAILRSCSEALLRGLAARTFRSCRRRSGSRR